MDAADAVVVEDVEVVGEVVVMEVVVEVAGVVVVVEVVDVEVVDNVKIVIASLICFCQVPHVPWIVSYVCLFFFLV